MLNFYKRAKLILKEGKFTLREWSSNSRSFNETKPAQDINSKDFVKVLGMSWDTVGDKILFKP